MGIGKHGSGNSWLRISVCFLLLTAYCFLLTALSSCGRRGDPVAVSPRVVEDAQEKNERGQDEGREAGAAEPAAGGEAGMTRPDAPEGLTALFTGKQVILTWGEVMGQGVEFYRMYRSEGDRYIVIGESATPAFSDKTIEHNATYIYEVTAVGQSESDRSGAVTVVTGE